MELMARVDVPTDHAKYVVINIAEGKLTYYGSTTTEVAADEIARVCNGVVFETFVSEAPRKAKAFNVPEFKKGE